jgi:ATP-dependent DNA ligase
MPFAQGPASTRPGLNVSGAAYNRSRFPKHRSTATAAHHPLWLAARPPPRALCGPELVAEVNFCDLDQDNLPRQVVYEGLHEDKPAAEVRRLVPYPKTS